LSKLDEIEKFKKKELEIQIEDLKFGIEGIIGSCKVVENSISLSNDNKNGARLLSMKNLYHSRLDYLSNNIWKIEPCHHSLIEFSSISEEEEESIYSSISNIGTIDANEISAEKCLISRVENQKIFKNEEYKFEIISYSKKGSRMEKGGNGKQFQIQIYGELKNEDNGCEILDLNNGRYEVKMTLKDEGNYSIFVKHHGSNVKFSPFQIEVFPRERNFNQIKRPKFTFGSHGNGNNQFNGPWEITTDSKGNIFVSDYYNNRIQIFDSRGKFVSTLGSQGNGNGQFIGPYGITINSKGNVIVSDYHTHRIQIFDTEGNFISTFGSKGNNNGQFNNPRGICVDSNDNIYVCDSSNHRIQIFDSKGKFLSTFGSYGNGNGQFNGPHGITINSKGNIIVSDFNNHRIQIFDSEGKFISTFGSQGKFLSSFGSEGNGKFNNPRGICVDLNDNILVCDFGYHRVQIFGPNGGYIGQFKVNQPMDIIFDYETQNIIVCGNDNKISIF